MSGHVCGAELTPTPRGGMLRIYCVCGFRSVPVIEREVEMWLWMHESAVPGLPGTRLGGVDDGALAAMELAYAQLQQSGEVGDPA